MRSPIITGFFEVAERDASKQGLLAVVPTLFSSICGFFVIECMCRQCVERADGYITWHELTSLWDSTCKKLENLCTANLHTIRNPDEAMLMKENILLLTEALADDAFSMRPQGLVSMMQIIWNRFEELQVEFIVSVCAHALDSCAYQPLSITTKERFDSQIKAFKLDKVRLQEVQTSSANQSAISAAISAGKNMSASATLDALEENMEIGRSSVSAAASAPDTSDPRRKSLTGSTSSSRTQQFIAQTFPFSEAVPVILRELHLMITKFFAFAVKNKQLKSVGESVCMAVQKAFVGMSHTMLKKLLQDGAETPLSKACQISIDAATFAEVTNYLKTLLSGMLVHFKFVDSVENHLTTAIQTARKELADVSSHAQDLVFELLALKVDDLLGSLVFINWEPEQYPTGPHDSIEEVVDYLRATFMWLTHLPQAAREAAHFTCCSKVQSGIIDYILSPQVSRLNILSIVALEFDVRRLENFADSCGVRQLSLCFAELHELVRALLHPELPQFGDNPQLRRSLFPRLDPARLARVIEKVLWIVFSIVIFCLFMCVSGCVCMLQMSASPPAAMGANLPRIDKKLVLTLSKKLKVQSKD